jgi:hypothetical protein
LSIEAFSVHPQLFVNTGTAAENFKLKIVNRQSSIVRFTSRGDSRLGHHRPRRRWSFRG